MKKLFFLPLIAVSLMCCKTTKKVSDLTEGDIEFLLKKGSCFGECPIYTMEIYEGGHATFKGRRFTEKIGKYTRQVDNEKYKTLQKAFKDADFDKFETFYESSIPDLPSISIGFKFKDTLKTVKGKRERPTELHRLQFLLEEIAETNDGWTFVEELSEPELEKPQKPKYITSQIILQPRDGLQLPRWFDKMQKSHGVRILKKLIEGDNLWLITYDTMKTEPEAMLQLLKDDPDIVSAEFNKEVTPRK